MRIIRDRARWLDCRPLHDAAMPDVHRGFWSSGDYGPGDDLWVAEEAGEVCGYLLGEFVGTKYAIGMELVVAEQHRRRGVGRALALAFARAVSEAGIVDIYLQVLHGPGVSLPLHSIYRSWGFDDGPSSHMHAEVRTVIDRLSGARRDHGRDHGRG